MTGRPLDRDTSLITLQKPSNVTKLWRKQTINLRDPIFKSSKFKMLSLPDIGSAWSSSNSSSWDVKRLEAYANVENKWNLWKDWGIIKRYHSQQRASHSYHWKHLGPWCNHWSWAYGSSCSFGGTFWGYKKGISLGFGFCIFGIVFVGVFYYWEIKIRRENLSALEEKE